MTPRFYNDGRIDVLAAMDDVHLRLQASNRWTPEVAEARAAVAELIAAAEAMTAFVFLDGIPFDEVDKWPPSLRARLDEFLNRKGDLQLALKRVRGDA